MTTYINTVRINVYLCTIPLLSTIFPLNNLLYTFFSLEIIFTFTDM